MIDKPSSDNNYFTLFLKYTTLFIVAWFASWAFLLYTLDRNRSEGYNDFVFDNAGLISIIIAFGIITFFIKNAIKKYRFGIPFKMAFDDQNNALTIRVTNTLNDKEKNILIAYSELSIIEVNKADRLFGKQRIFEFFQQKLLMARVNIDMTAWCRVENLDDLLLLLRKNYSKQEMDIRPADEEGNSVLNSTEELL